MDDIAVLILGGTGEGFALAEALVPIPGLQVLSSLAGRVTSPRLPPGDVRTGGFGGAEGLAGFLRERNIAAVIDATHPFARRMGWNAAKAATLGGVPLLRFERPAWRRQAGDCWVEVADWDAAIDVLGKSARRVFLSLGRQELAPFTALADISFVIRSVEMPDPSIVFKDAEFILARGPFQLEGERELLASRRIDHLVCKNSGGTATDAKLQAAREQGITVLMQSRPPRPEVPMAASIADAIDWLRAVRAR